MRCLVRDNALSNQVTAFIYLPGPSPAKYCRRYVSLTSVFGMGTGGSSPPSTPSFSDFLSPLYEIPPKVSSKLNNLTPKANFSFA